MRETVLTVLRVEILHIHELINPPSRNVRNTKTDSKTYIRML